MPPVLHATVDFMPAHNEWWAMCDECSWVSTHTSSGTACDAADWHDVEAHTALDIA